MAQIIDGRCDFDNVTADVIARHNMSLYGTGDFVLKIDECLGYELISNNEIHVKDGMFIMQGRRGYIKKGTADVCIIENGAQAVNRNDIIVMEYSKDEVTMLESHTTKIIKGVAAAEAVDPEIITGDINAGDVLHQMPLYRVRIEGLNVVAVEQMFEIGSVVARIELEKEAYGFRNSHTVFNPDGSITETMDYDTVETIFNSDGSILNVLTDATGNVVTKKTVFNSDGSITSVVE